LTRHCHQVQQFLSPLDEKISVSVLAEPFERLITIVSFWCHGIRLFPLKEKALASNHGRPSDLHLWQDGGPEDHHPIELIFSVSDLFASLYIF
jgi:hypothetical protein